MPEEQDSGLSRAIATEFASVETSVSLSQKVLVISEDRLELSVRDGIEKVRSNSAWVAPLGIFLSCLAASLTSDFKDRFYVPKELWQALFIIGTVSSLIWLMRALSRRSSFDHAAFMALIRNSASKQRLRNEAAGAAEAALSNVEIPISVRIQCSQCGYALPPSDGRGKPRVCEKCGSIN